MLRDAGNVALAEQIEQELRAVQAVQRRCAQAMRSKRWMPVGTPRKRREEEMPFSFEPCVCHVLNPLVDLSQPGQCETSSGPVLGRRIV